MIVAIGNFKGGTAKTTSAAHIAAALAHRGRTVLGIDGDPPASFLRWADLGGWDVPVVGLASKSMHTRIPGISAGYDDAVIDTPPLEEQAGIVYSALRAADLLVVPVSPTTMELDRLMPIIAATEEIEPLRETPLTTCVLLTRTITNASSTAAAREVISDAGLTVLDAQVPRREQYAQAFGAPITITDGDPYDHATAEIIELGTD